MPGGTSRSVGGRVPDVGAEARSCTVRPPKAAPTTTPRHPLIHSFDRPSPSSFSREQQGQTPWRCFVVKCPCFTFGRAASMDALVGSCGIRWCTSRATVRGLGPLPLHLPLHLLCTRVCTVFALILLCVSFALPLRRLCNQTRKKEK